MNNNFEGKKIIGNKGCYKIGEHIIDGGNSSVYYITGQGLSCRCVVKILNIYDNDKKWLVDKRKQRFKREIDAINYILDNDCECNILPIYDYSYSENEMFWYIMPFAVILNEHLKSTRNNVIDKIGIAIKLAEIIEHLQSLNKPLAHRDIKLQNLYMYNEKLHLADFGLVWSEDADIITVEEEQVGAYSTRAPWMHRAGINRDIKSELSADVYSFVKTVWWILTLQKYSFQGTYNIKNPAFTAIEKTCKQYSKPTKTIAPLHKLFELSNISTAEDMPPIQECLRFLYEFIEANDNVGMARKINRDWIIRDIFGNCNAEKIEFKTVQSIVKIMNKINNQYRINVGYNTITMSHIDSVPTRVKESEKYMGDYKILITSDKNVEYTLIPLCLQIDRGSIEPQLSLYTKSYVKEAESISVRDILPGVPVEPNKKIEIDIETEIKLQPILL